ncbi:hypothetical protein EDB19DRAFT_1768223, partial [Suillus lakei]
MVGRCAPVYGYSTSCLLLLFFRSFWGMSVFYLKIQTGLDGVRICASVWGTPPILCASSFWGALDSIHKLGYIDSCPFFHTLRLFFPSSSLILNRADSFVRCQPPLFSSTEPSDTE